MKEVKMKFPIFGNWVLSRMFVGMVVAHLMVPEGNSFEFSLKRVVIAFVVMFLLRFPVAYFQDRQKRKPKKAHARS
ncbi:MAG: hypothetical protein V4690_01280 [Patescibacteria group bacterium]